MKSLQSQAMPLRTLDQFYQPYYKEKIVQSIKVFPQKLQKNENILTPRGEAESILQYLSGLNAARQLPRRVQNRKQYYPFLGGCRRHHNRGKLIDCRDVPQVSIDGDAKEKRFETLVSSNPTNLSTIESLNRKIQLQKIQFKQSSSARGLSQTKEMRFSFYNTIEKSDYFLKKFRQDSSLNERRTNKYQNMFNRTITAQKIITLLDSSRSKLKIGKL